MVDIGFNHNPQLGDLLLSSTDYTQQTPSCICFWSFHLIFSICQVPWKHSLWSLFLTVKTVLQRLLSGGESHLSMRAFERSSFVLLLLCWGGGQQRCFPRWAPAGQSWSLPILSVPFLESEASVGLNSVEFFRIGVFTDSSWEELKSNTANAVQIYGWIAIQLLKLYF